MHRAKSKLLQLVVSGTPRQEATKGSNDCLLMGFMMCVSF
jgi:hypothetical protein